ncbi:hypothetical protein Tco_0378891 [Tanacetum coccineum]
MANQEQNPPQQEQPFVAAKQVGFNLEDIILNTNNEVALLYPEHNNKDHFKCVSDFISKCCLRKPFTRSPNMYKEYLAEFWYSAKTLENSKVFFSTPTGGIYGEVGVNTFRNAIGAHYLPHSSEYVGPRSIDIVRPWFETIGHREVVPTKGTLKKSLLPQSLANGININYASILWEDIIIKLNKKHREKVVPCTRSISLLMMHKMKECYGDGELTLYHTQVFSVNNWALKPNQPEEPPFTDHMLAICAADKPMVFKAHKTSSKAESVFEGTKPGAKSGHNKLSSLKQPFVSAMDSNRSQPPVSTHVDTGMNKEDQQATGGPTSLGVTSEARANPHLSSGMSTSNLNKPIYSSSFIVHSESASSYDASADSTTEVDPRLSAPRPSSIARQIEEEDTSNTIKLKDLEKLVSDVPSFKDPDSPEDDPVIVVDDSDEDEEDEHKLELEKNKAETKVALFKAQPSFPKFLNILSAHDFSSSLPTVGKNKSIGQRTAKQKVKVLLSRKSRNIDPTPTELKDLPFKLDELTREVKGLKKQVHELEIELLGYLKEIPTKLDDFTKNVTSLTSQVAELKTLLEHIKKDKGKKAMFLKDAKEVSTKSESDDETTQVPGFMVESSKKKELKKFDFVTESGEHVHLTKEQISAQKKIEEEAKAEATGREGEIRKEELIDLLGPEVVNKYYNDKLQYDRYYDKMLNRRAKSRITNCDILNRNGLITLKVYREDDTSEIIPEFKASDLHLSEWREVITACPNKKVELGIDLDKPLSERDPLDRLNDLANKKRKHADDIHNFFRANKRLKSSVQYEDHPAGTVLNEPVLEIFFRLHQGLGLDDHARTFSSLLLVEIDKRNLKPLKQMRVIEQLRQ